MTNEGTPRRADCQQSRSPDTVSDLNQKLYERIDQWRDAPIVGTYRNIFMLERIVREIRRRTRVVGSFPDGRSALMPAAARLRYVSGSRWGTRRCLDMNRIKEMQDTEMATADNAAA